MTVRNRTYFHLTGCCLWGTLRELCYTVSTWSCNNKTWFTFSKSFFLQQKTRLLDVWAQTIRVTVAFNWSAPIGVKGNNNLNEENSKLFRASISRPSRSSELYPCGSPPDLKQTVKVIYSDYPTQSKRTYCALSPSHRKRNTNYKHVLFPPPQHWAV